MSQGYKGRVLDPMAFELPEGTGWTAEVYVAGGWTAEVYVAGDVEDEAVESQFLVVEVFPTEEAALSAALIVGKREVDKRIRRMTFQWILTGLGKCGGHRTTKNRFD